MALWSSRLDRMCMTASRRTSLSWRKSHLIYACAVVAAPRGGAIVCASTTTPATSTPTFAMCGPNRHRRRRLGFTKQFSSTHHASYWSAFPSKVSHSFSVTGGGTRCVSSRNLPSSRRGRKGDDAGEEISDELFDDDDDDVDDPYNAAIETETLHWIKRVVIGLNFCPFAEKPLLEKKLKISVVRGDDDETVAAAVLYEMIVRMSDSNAGTTVVVAPEYHPKDFQRYMSLVQLLEEDIMEQHDMHGIVQVAPFHPFFEFNESGEDGVDNFTNRSPYPMFHILREKEVSSAVAKLKGDASIVWERNVRLLEAMADKFGREGFLKAMSGEKIAGMDDFLKDAKNVEVENTERR